MKQVGRWTWPFLGLAVLLVAACSHQPGIIAPQEDAQTKPLPFNRPSHDDGISPTQAFAFSSMPAGTAVVIRLQSPLSSAKAHLGDHFEAVLEEPIVVQGQTLAASGTEVTGRVLAAKASQPRQPGYVRLTLSSIFLKGKALDLHTSSVFSKGGQGEHLKSGAAANDIKFSTGQRLTFHLIQPLPLQG